MKQKGKTWTDGKGNEIPTYAINPVLKTEEKHSQKVLTTALRAEKYLIETVELVKAAYKEVYDAKVKDANMKGNKSNFNGMTINSFDSKIEVKVTKPDTLYFDNTYTEMVKEKFSEYFNGLNAGNDTAMFMKDLVNDLMYTSGGRLDNSKVLKLRKYRERLTKSKALAEKSKAFIEAVDIFDKAIKNKPGNMGIYISVFDEDAQKMRRVVLKYSDAV